MMDDRFVRHLRPESPFLQKPMTPGTMPSSVRAVGHRDIEKHPTACSLAAELEEHLGSRRPRACADHAERLDDGVQHVGAHPERRVRHEARTAARERVQERNVTHRNELVQRDAVVPVPVRDGRDGAEVRGQQSIACGAISVPPPALEQSELLFAARRLRLSSRGELAGELVGRGGLRRRNGGTGFGLDAHGSGFDR
jgi:hypothetical protein